MNNLVMDRRWSTRELLNQNRDAYTWRPLRILNLYRTLLTFLLSIVVIALGSTPIFTPNNASLFAAACLGYFVFSLFSSAAATKRFPSFFLQVHTQALIDIAALSTLIFALGERASNLNILLIVSVVGASILVSKRYAVIYAATATIALLCVQTLLFLKGTTEVSDYSAAGISGLALFVSAIGAATLARHAEEFELLANVREQDIESLEHVNEHIVERMQSGVIAIDANFRIKLANVAAQNILSLHKDYHNLPLPELCPNLHQQFEVWQETRLQTGLPLQTQTTHALARFVKLGESASDGVIIFLEDEAQVTQRIQDAKLASLGRLTASIAHEIRNPLGAISHAGQLLAESEDLVEGDKRLTEIILNHAKRLNTIVENVLQLSRRQRPNVEKINLHAWLEQFANEFRAQNHLSERTLQLELGDRELGIEMDATHLHQVLWNLCSNALNHSGLDQDACQICIKTSQNEKEGRYIEVYDNGRGISQKDAEEIFEPFFTTNTSGTGLGLYLCKELCASNNVNLVFLHKENAGACFRLIFTELK